MVAVIQQIGYEITYVATFAGFIDLHVSWLSVARHMKRIYTVIGPIQIEKWNETKMDALVDNIIGHNDHGYDILHECEIVLLYVLLVLGYLE